MFFVFVVGGGTSGLSHIYIVTYCYMNAYLKAYLKHSEDCHSRCMTELAGRLITLTNLHVGPSPKGY